jgi:hypothetical protein
VELKHAMSNPLERWMHHTKTTVIDTADISMPTIGFQKQQLVIRLRALYGTDNNVSPLIPIAAGKPQNCYHSITHLKSLFHCICIMWCAGVLTINNAF